MSVIHSLKTRKIFFDAVSVGEKRAELRMNDRDFQCGDYLLLREWEGEYTGRKLIVKVTHILPVEKLIGDGKGWVMLSITFIGTKDVNSLSDAKFGGKQ